MLLAVTTRVEADGISVNNPPGQIQVSLGSSENISVTVESTPTLNEFTVASTSFFDAFASITALEFTFQADKQTVLLLEDTLPFTASLTLPIVLNGGSNFFNAVEDYTTGGNTFDLSGFTPIVGSLTNHGTVGNSIVVATNSNVTLTDTALMRGISGLGLTGFDNVSLTMTGGTNELEVTGWSGGFHLTNNSGSRVLIVGSVELNNAVNNGTLVFNAISPSASDSSASGLSGGGNVEVANGGSLVLNGSVTSGDFNNSPDGAGVLLDAGGVLTMWGTTTITGGNAFNQEADFAAGSGGSGVLFNGNGTMNANSGATITGGNGGVAAVASGNGGSGVLFSGDGTMNANSGVRITGGTGGGGGVGSTSGTGGTAVYFQSTGIMNTASGVIITGGNGGDATTYAGAGGSGVFFNAAGTLTNGNGATISGGTGGGDEAVGVGGTAIVFNAGGTLVNQAGGTVNAGPGGSGWVVQNGTLHPIYGPRGLGVIFQGGAGNLTNAGTINGDVLMGNFANTVTLVEGGIISGNLTLGNNAASALYLTANGNRTYSSFVTGSTTGSGFMTKEGSGVLTIDQAFDLSGGIVINDGAIGYANGITVSGPIVSQIDAVLFVGDSASATQQGAISESGGSFGLTKDGTGTLVLSGANSYSGETIITGGRLVAGNNSALGTGSVTIGASANGLGYLDGVEIPNAIVLTSNSSLHAGDNAAATQQGVVSESGGTFELTKVGGGSLTLSGANTYSGGTSLTGGTLVATSSASMGNGSITFMGGTLQYATGLIFDFSSQFSTAPGQQFSIDTNGNNVTFHNSVVSNGGSFTKSGEGLLNLSGANTYSGGTSLAGGTLVATNSASMGSGSITFMGGTLRYATGLNFDFSPQFSTAPGQQFSIDTNGNNVTFHNAVVSNGGSFTKSGEGLLNLSGANSFSAGVTVAQGDLQLGSATEISGTNGANAPSMFDNGGNGGSGASFTAFGTLTINTGTSISGGNGGNTDLGSGGTGGDGVVFQSGGNLTSDAGAFISGGNGGSNNWGSSPSGTGVVFQGGIGNLTNAGTINNGVAMDNFANRVTLMAGGVINGDLNMSQNLGTTLILGGTGNQTYSAAVTGGTTFAGSLVKQGAGTWTLDQSLTPTGGTTISEGRLNLTSTLGGNALVVVGALLSGNGTISGDLTVRGTQAPGSSPGIQTVGGNLTYSGGFSSVEWELEANAIGTRGIDFDGINVGGDLIFEDATILMLDFAVNVDWTDAFWNTDKLGTSGWLVYDVTGGSSSFSNLGLSASSTWLDKNGVLLSAERAGASFSLYQDGSDIFLNYSAIPEPSTIALIALGLAAFAFHRRLRRAGAVVE